MSTRPYAIMNGYPFQYKKHLTLERECIWKMCNVPFFQLTSSFRLEVSLGLLGWSYRDNVLALFISTLQAISSRPKRNCNGIWSNEVTSVHGEVLYYWYSKREQPRFPLLQIEQIDLVYGCTWFCYLWNFIFCREFWKH